MSLNQQQIDQAMKIRKLGRYGKLPWSKVARAMGVRRRDLLLHFDPNFRDQHQFEQGWIVVKKTLDMSEPSTPVRIPEMVIEERERRRGLVPRSLTASIFGDPLPGYSALDRRRQA